MYAYASGYFPMPFHRRTIGWWSPDPRGVLPLDGLKVSRSLRRSRRRFDVQVDTAFEQVIRICADLPRPNGWINDDIVDAYLRLHRLGLAHSYETWQGGRLVGGLYGVEIRGLFAGESMFHAVTDASKVALCSLVDDARRRGITLLDVQWGTDHLRSLGVIDIPRRWYLKLLREALEASTTPITDGPGTPPR